MQEAEKISVKLGLKFKFMLVISLLLMMIGCIIGLTLFVGLQRSFESQLQKRGLALASSVASNGSAAISTEDKALLKQMTLGIVDGSETVYLVLINNDGKVIFSSEESESDPIHTDPLTTQAVKTAEPTVYRYRNHSGNYLDVVAPVILNPMRSEGGKRVGSVRLGLSLKNIEAESGRLLTIILPVIALLVGIGIVISLFFAQIIIGPLEQMSAIAVQIAEGNFQQSIEIKTNDEVGILAAALSKMSVGLKGMIKKIQDASQQVATVSDKIMLNAKRINEGANHQAKAAEKTSSSIEEMNASVKSISENIDGLSASAEATSSSLIQMSTAISQVATSTVTLSGSVEDTASSLLQMSGSIKQVVEHVDALSMNAEATTASINEVNASIREVEKNAKESALMTEKVSQDAAELGMGAIEKTIEGMEKIKRTVEKSENVIKKLDERTEHIGKILTVIDEVTRQTNLLALNAAILAAQAGEQGKGFAVVADEIKNLADRTASSTKEIAQLIVDVQTEAKDAVVSINEGALSVEEGVRLSVNARESLNKILETSKQSSSMSRQIEKATYEQVQAINQVSQAMEKMNVMVQQINRAMQEQMEGIEHITEASEKMRVITRQVKSSTEEQANGSKQISDAVEDVTLRIQQIGRGMSEHKKGSEVIVKSILEIHQITQVSMQMALQMRDAVEGLITQANGLKDEIDRFKV
ncbi:MAG: HAMP domain-containing protein [Nitrospirae bacterium]|nr:HAMP domain-containing protein [Candidatus Manganitrophaceae bacterium]